MKFVLIESDVQSWFVTEAFENMVISICRRTLKRVDPPRNKGESEAYNYPKTLVFIQYISGFNNKYLLPLCPTVKISPLNTKTESCQGYCFLLHPSWSTSLTRHLHKQSSEVGNREDAAFRLPADFHT